MYCTSCKQAFDRERYATKTPEQHSRKREKRKERIAENIRLVREYLESHPCVDCGEADIVVLEFDHVRGDKMMNLSDMIRQSYSWARITAEIAKCDVRCANCHRRVTAARRQSTIPGVV